MKSILIKTPSQKKYDSVKTTPMNPIRNSSMKILKLNAFNSSFLNQSQEDTYVNGLLVEQELQSFIETYNINFPCSIKKLKINSITVNLLFKILSIIIFTYVVFFNVFYINDDNNKINSYLAFTILVIKFLIFIIENLIQFSYFSNLFVFKLINKQQQETKDSIEFKGISLEMLKKTENIFSSIDYLINYIYNIIFISFMVSNNFKNEKSKSIEAIFLFCLVFIMSLFNLNLFNVLISIQIKYTTLVLDCILLIIAIILTNENNFYYFLTCFIMLVYASIVLFYFRIRKIKKEDQDCSYIQKILNYQSCNSYQNILKDIPLGFSVINSHGKISIMNNFFEKNLRSLIIEQNTVTDDKLQINNENEEKNKINASSKLPIELDKKSNYFSLLNSKCAENNSMFLDINNLIFLKTQENIEGIKNHEETNFPNLSVLTNNANPNYETLKDKIDLIVKANTPLKSFAFLGRFKLKVKKVKGKEPQMNHKILDIYIRQSANINIIDESEIKQNENEPLYELFFIDYSDTTKVSKLTAEKKIKNLLLSKISHEFRTPTINIQNIIDKIVVEANLNKQTLDNSGHPALYSIYDDLKRIRYLSEIVLILISDLGDYINNDKYETKNSNDQHNNTANKSIIMNSISPIQQPSVIKIKTLRDYMGQLCKNLLDVFCKSNFLIIINFQDNIENKKLTIDDKKLKQIICNILSNAIKNTDKGGIKISFLEDNINIDKLESHDTSNINYTIKKKITLDLQNNNQITLCKIESDCFKLSPSQKDSKVKIKKNTLTKIKTIKEDVDENDSSRIEYSKFNAFDHKNMFIIIEDTGYGMPKDIVKKMNDSSNMLNFDHRLNDSNEIGEYVNNKGIGIGLILCKRLSRELGIKMICKSKYSEKVNIVKNQTEKTKSSNEIFRVKANERIGSSLIRQQIVNKSISLSHNNIIKIKGSETSKSVLNNVNLDIKFLISEFENIGTKFILQFNEDNVDSGNLSSSDESSFINENDVLYNRFNNRSDKIISPFTNSSKKNTRHKLNSTKDTKNINQILNNEKAYESDSNYDSVKDENYHTNNTISEKNDDATGSNINSNNDTIKDNNIKIDILPNSVRENISFDNQSANTKSSNMLSSKNNLIDLNIFKLAYKNNEVNVRRKSKSSENVKSHDSLAKTIPIRPPCVSNLNLRNMEFDQNEIKISLINVDENTDNLQKLSKMNLSPRKRGKIPSDISKINPQSITSTFTNSLFGNSNTNITSNNTGLLQRNSFFMKNNKLPKKSNTNNSQFTPIGNSFVYNGSIYSYGNGDKKNDELNISAIPRKDIQRRSDVSNHDIGLISDIKEEDHACINKSALNSNKSQLNLNSKLNKSSLLVDNNRSNSLIYKNGKVNRKSTFTFQNTILESVVGTSKKISKLNFDNFTSQKDLHPIKKLSFKNNIISNNNLSTVNKAIREYRKDDESNASSATSRENYLIGRNKMKIIIVEDNENILNSHFNLFKSILTSKGMFFNYKIIKAKDGFEAAYHIYKDTRDNLDSIKLVVSDEMMTYMNGTELYSLVNTKLFEKNSKSVPFIIVSAFNNQSHFEKINSLGLDCYSKPINKGNVEYFYEKYLSKYENDQLI